MNSRRCGILATLAAVLVAVLPPIHAAGNDSGPDNHAKIIPVNDSLYRSIDLLYNEAGLALPSGSRPWSIDEWNHVLLRLETHQDREARSLSAAGRDTVERIRQRLADERQYRAVRGDSYQADISAAVALEAYGHTNTDDFPVEADWVYGYTDRAAAATVALEMELHNWFYLYTDVAYRKNRYAYEESTDSATSEPLYNKHLTTNLHLLDQVAFETPYRAFASAGGDRWNLTFGRESVRWGHGRSGNFVLNDHLDYHDLLRFVSYHERLKVEATYLFLHHSEFTTDSEEPPQGMRMFLGHRVEFRPVPRLSFAITENVMYQTDAEDGVDPGVLNPAYIFHNFNNRSMFNAIVSAEAEAAVLPGVTLLYQFSLYQAQAPLEGGSQPAAMAHLAGYRVAHPYGRGYLYHELEGVYSDTYMYQRDIVDMKVLRREFVHGYGFATHREFLGYPYGGDVVVFSTVFGYHRPEAFDVRLDIEHLRQGEIGIDTTIDSTGDFELGRRSPSGTVEDRLRTGVEAGWNPWRSLKVFGRLDLVHVWNKGNESASVVWDLQYALGTSYRF
ncbi:MAG: hypothetical protein LC641_07960 [Spirochaeta sp.]|nr:hypothetical protein [Spirochaeta sp.]